MSGSPIAAVHDESKAMSGIELVPEQIQQIDISFDQLAPGNLEVHVPNAEIIKSRKTVSKVNKLHSNS
jgi:hypothetical protein